MTHVTMPQVFPGAVSCPERQAVHDTRAKYFIKRRMLLSEHYRLATRASLFWWYSEEIMLGKLVASSAIISIILVAILLQVTTPASAGPLGIFMLFVLVYVSVLGVLTYLIFCVSL